MILFHSAASKRHGQRLAAAALASTALLAAGCSNLVSTAPTSSVASVAATLGGKVHGGNQPVAGATVQLFFAGQNGIAAGATLAATTRTADDGAGSFSFIKAPDGTASSGALTNIFSCPAPSAAGTPYVYVVARGGNTLNNHDLTVNNSASVFLAPLGFCGTLSSSTFVYMSEAVTAATVAAVHQYMKESTGEIGADGILSAYDGLANSFNLVSNMVSLSTGQTLASTPLTGPLAGVTVTATPEQAKLNQVANILAACINNASSSATACSTLFSAATPPPNPSTTSTPGTTFTAATDVLQAAYYMFTNPTSSSTANLTALYNLSAASGAAYQPTLSTLPSDWSIGIQYVASGSCGTSTSDFINNPYDLNIDQIGNIWIANNQAGGSSLSEVTATGLPTACVPIGGASHGGTIDTATTTAPSGPVFANKIWVGEYEHNIVYRYNPADLSKLAFPTSTSPLAMAADGVGNVYYTTLGAPGGQGSVWMIPGAASATAAVAPVQISNSVGTTPARMLVDANGAIWVSSRDVFVSLITPAAAGAPGILNGYVTTSVTTPDPTYGLAATQAVVPNGATGVYVSAQDPRNTIDQLTGSGTTYAEAPGFPSAPNAGGLNSPSAIAVDGAQNVWAANDGLDSGSGLSLVSELSRTGTSLSPNGTVAGGFQKDPAFFGHGRIIAVDQSGNVWVGTDGSSALTEIVGAAVPVFQPFSLGLASHRFQTIP